MATASTQTDLRLKSGQVIRVHQRITEGNKERIQIFEGLVIDLHGHVGPSATFTVRRVVDGIGVEKIFPVESAFIDKIDIIKEAKVRRANLSYMRERTGKAARLKDETILNLVWSKPHEVEEEEVVEGKVEEDTGKAKGKVKEEKAQAKGEEEVEVQAQEENVVPSESEKEAPESQPSELVEEAKTA